MKKRIRKKRGELPVNSKHIYYVLIAESEYDESFVYLFRNYRDFAKKKNKIESRCKSIAAEFDCRWPYSLAYDCVSLSSFREEQLDILIDERLDACEKYYSASFTDVDPIVDDMLFLMIGGMQYEKYYCPR